MKEINQRQLRNDSGEIMRGLDEGESYVVTRDGTPVGELTPLRRHRFVAAETVVAIFRRGPSCRLDRRRPPTSQALGLVAQRHPLGIIDTSVPASRDHPIHRFATCARDQRAHPRRAGGRAARRRKLD